MIVDISAEDAHGTHITYEIAETSNEIRPTSLKEVALKMPLLLLKYSARVTRLVVHR